MHDFLATVLTNLAIIVLGCTLLHQLFTRLLERIIPDKMPVYKEIFTLTNPVLTQGIAKPSLKLKYLLPWTASPDLSAFGSSAANFFIFNSVVCCSRNIIPSF